MQISSKLNYWLVSKRLGKWTDIVDDVEGFDCSALKPAYALARASLLDDADNFFELLDRYDGAKLDKRAWLEWPNFDEMRDDPRYSDYQVRYIKLDEDDSDVGQDEDSIGMS